MQEINSTDTTRNEDQRPQRVLTVDLTRRLPDISHLESVPQDLEQYGRLAILQSGILWFGDIHSSHPGTAQSCFYWAFAGSTLYISPDGSTLGWQDFINAKTVKFIAAKLNLRRRFHYFTVVL